MKATHGRYGRAAGVGDMVAFDYGGGLTVTGKVVEDRGHIGVGGRRLVRVRVEIELGAEPMFIELPDKALTVVKRPRSAPNRRSPPSRGLLRLHRVRDAAQVSGGPGHSP